jgi:hypothetical protein
MILLIISYCIQFFPEINFLIVKPNPICFTIDVEKAQGAAFTDFILGIRGNKSIWERW